MIAGLPRTLGLFPRLDEIGGVQAAGRLAWDAICRESTEDAFLFCYDAMLHRTGHNGRMRPVIGAAARGVAIIKALSRRWPVQIVLVWHISLLRLWPFFRVPGARLVVCLMGVEAWRRQDFLTRLLLRRAT